MHSTPIYTDCATELGGTGIRGEVRSSEKELRSKVRSGAWVHALQLFQNVECRVWGDKKPKRISNLPFMLPG